MNSRADYIILALFSLFLLALPQMVENEYYLGILAAAAVNVLACTGLSLLMGYAGQISMGHAGFIALGAYATAIFCTKFGWTPWPAMIAGAGISLAVSLLIGIPSLRLKGHYLAMATLGFGSIVHIVCTAATGITGGPEGISEIPPLALGSLVLDSDLRAYYLLWGAVIIGLFLAINLVSSRMGRGLMALHGSEDAAASVGVDVSACKIIVFGVSAVYASVSGSLYASYVRYIDPGPFDVMHSVLLVTMVAVGGMHRIWGAVLGAVLLSLLPEALSTAADTFYEYGIAYDTDYDMLIHGGILLLIMLFMPEGLIQGPAMIRRTLRRGWRRICAAAGETAA